MKNIRLSAIALLLAAAVCGCGKDKAEHHQVNPLILTPDELTLEVMLEAAIRVEGADEFKVSITPEIATFSRDGNMIRVRAVEQGSATVTVRSEDRRSAGCRLTVIPRETLPQLPTSELADPTPRFVSQSLTLRYGAAGVMYMSADGHKLIRMMSVDTPAETVSFMPGEPALYVKGRQMNIALVRTTETEKAVYYQILDSTDGEILLLVAEPVR